MEEVSGGSPLPMGPTEHVINPSESPQNLYLSPRLSSGGLNLKEVPGVLWRRGMKRWSKILFHSRLTVQDDISRNRIDDDEVHSMVAEEILIGPAYPTGPTRPKGLATPSGPTGPAGPAGRTGLRRSPSFTRPTGRTGPTCPASLTSPMGPTGLTCLNGPKYGILAHCRSSNITVGRR